MSTKLQERVAKGMSSSQKTGKKDMKAGKNDNIITASKQLTLAEATLLKSVSDASGESVMLAELRKLRQENSDSFREKPLCIEWRHPWRNLNNKRRGLTDD